MSDERLRELERRWKETGAVADEAAYLLERVRIGSLTPTRLELAAYCGSEGARQALDGPPSADLQSLLRRLEALSAVKIAIAAATSVIPIWAAGEKTDEPQSALRAARDAMNCPCPDHEEKAAQLAFTAEATASSQARLGFEDRRAPHVLAGKAAGAAAEAASNFAGGEPQEGLDEAIRAVTQAIEASSERAVCAAILPAILE